MQKAQHLGRIDLEPYGITVEDVDRNPPVPQLYADSIRADARSVIAESGALIAYSGEKTGRSPLDKRVVEHDDSIDEVWWGPINIPITDDVFHINRERAIDFLNTQPRLYCVDAFAGWNPDTRARPGNLCPPVPRAVHAYHAYPADARRVGHVW